MLLLLYHSPTLRREPEHGVLPHSRPGHALHIENPGEKTE